MLLYSHVTPAEKPHILNVCSSKILAFRVFKAAHISFQNPTVLPLPLSLKTSSFPKLKLSYRSNISDNPSPG